MQKMWFAVIMEVALRQQSRIFFFLFLFIASRCIHVSVHGRSTEMDRICNIFDIANISISKNLTLHAVLKVVSLEELGKKNVIKYQPLKIAVYQDDRRIRTVYLKPKEKTSFIPIESTEALNRSRGSFVYVEFQLECAGNCDGCSPDHRTLYFPRLEPSVTTEKEQSPNKEVTDGGLNNLVILLVSGILCFILIVTYLLVKKYRGQGFSSSSEYICMSTQGSRVKSDHNLVVFKDDNLEDDIFTQIQLQLQDHFDIILPRDHQLEISNNKHDWIEKCMSNCRNFLSVVKDEDEDRYSPAEMAVIDDIKNLNNITVVVLHIFHKSNCVSIKSGKFVNFPFRTVMSCHSSMVNTELEKVVSYFRS